MMSKNWNPIWKPKLGETYYYDPLETGINYSIYEHDFHDEPLVRTYNAFPNRQVTRLGFNLSKLDRMILLWQYANNCLFEPDWLDGIQYKYYIIYDSRDINACYDYSFRQKSNNIHFETSEQVKTFIDMYEAEIKELMNIK